MDGNILTLLGGTGMFLLGMRMMTGALGQLASRQVRAVLRRVTTSPLTGVVAGAGATALVQSSSAILVMTIGFVGAGLLSFPQAMGVVFGANVGTTITGWMVVLLGFKLELARLALPLLFAASLLSALGRGAWIRAGTFLAGFSLIFLGLDMMQAGAEGFRDPMLSFAPAADTLWGRFRLLLLGVAVTVVIQSSSAGVAATLVLLGSGGLSLPQAAAMVIGMDIGTTFKSVLATIGGSRDMRRTAIAHVVYNVVTGIAAFTVVTTAVPALAYALGGEGPAALVAFHTLFNLLGVLLVLPFISGFARAIEWLLPGNAAVLGAPPDRHLLSDAPAALDAALGTSDMDAAAFFAALGARLAPGGTDAALAELAPLFPAALEDLGAFVMQIPLPEGQAAPLARRTALLHRIDHLNRLWHRTRAPDRLALLTADPVLQRPSAVLAMALRRAAKSPSAAGQHRRMDRIARLIALRAGRLRRAALLREHAGLVSPGAVFEQTDAIRSLERMARHAERILHYGEIAAMDAPPAQALWPEDPQNNRT